MKYNVFIQNNLTCVIEANDTDDALKIIAKKITDGDIVFDNSKPKGVRVEPTDE
jgi:hypothetical protein